jgi:hypothetical protein
MHMNIRTSDTLMNAEGKGFLGCMIAIILMAAIIFAGVKLGPIYYSDYLFEEDLKNLTSQAGARYISDDEITEDILQLAKKNKINIKQKDAKKDIEIKRFAGQVHINVRYYVPVNFLIFKKTLKFEIKLSSFTAA